MSVFTPLNQRDIQQFLQGFDVDVLLHFQGIEGGSENTNYFVTCRNAAGETTDYVLTLVERGPVQDLPFFVELLQCLQLDGLPVPYAIPDRHGVGLHTLRGKPALLQPRLPGEHPDSATALQCEALGSFLGRMHRIDCNLKRDADRGPQWIIEHARRMLRCCWQSDATWLTPLLADLQDWLDTQPKLPTCTIHGDLFRDNALFLGDELTGVIDFYNAATGWRVFDLAVCANDWCILMGDDGSISLDERRLRTLAEGYQAHISLTSAELASVPQVLQLAALRFWVSRQQYALQHRDQPSVLIKDPEYFRQVLRLHGESSL